MYGKRGVFVQTVRAQGELDGIVQNTTQEITSSLGLGVCLKRGGSPGTVPARVFGSGGQSSMGIG